MRAVVNPTGTHVQHGILKVRIDIYPDPSSKTYAEQYVDKTDRELTQEELDDPELMKLVPTHKELNPCLCHFMKVDEDISKTELEQLIRDKFDTVSLTRIDNALSKKDYKELRTVVKNITGTGKLVKKDNSLDNAKLKDSTNLRIKDIDLEL